MPPRKASEAKTTGASDANFGNAETIPADPVYIANFDGDEIDGKTYALGDTIDPKVDAGTIRYLVQVGRITESTKGDSKAPATGGPTPLTPPPPPADPLQGVTLSEEETAARDELVKDNNLDQLREIAVNEAVVGVTPEHDAEAVATLIVAHRRPA